MRNIIFVISGPSGVGKTTLIEELLKKRTDIARGITATTRAPRPGEQHNKDYYFLTEEDFERRKKGHDFVEVNTYNGFNYGTLKQELFKQTAKKSLLLNLEANGFRALKASARDQVRGIFLVPPSDDVLRERLLGRHAGQSSLEIEKRLASAPAEMEEAHTYDYQVTNDSVAAALQKMDDILTECMHSGYPS